MEQFNFLPMWNKSINIYILKSNLKKLNEKEYYNIPCKIAGTVNNDEILYKFNRSQSRFIQFALIAAAEAIKVYLI